MSKNLIRLSLDVSPELNQVLEDMAKKTHSSKSEALRKSIVLMDVAVQEKQKGHHLGIVGANGKVLKDIVGL